MGKEKEKEKQTKEVASWRPFPELFRMEREMERMFEDFWTRPWLGRPRRWRFLEEAEARAPAIEVYEEKDDVVVKAELAGMKKEDLEVRISENLLTLKGEKKKEEEKKEEGYHYSECSYGSFTRTIEIPRDVRADKATATFKDGLLEIRLPKTDEAKKKEVKIRVE
jgi:HSP20 family protein